ncbi:MAG TPA: ferredoxin reductase family protein [Candidatus Limnocylindrales bacterium]|jgi:predicted ferric reductase
MTTTTTLGARTRSGLRRLPVPIPRAYSGLRERDVWAVVAGVGAVLAGMWIRHGGLTQDPLTAIGQVTALGGTYAALLGVLFASRAPWLDQVIGSDRLRKVQGWLGFLSVWAIGAHAVTSTLAYAGGAIGQVIPTILSLVQTVPGMLGAIVGMGLFVVVAVSSMQAARRRVSYESWHGVHLYAYLAVAFGYLHQLTIGTDFVGDPLAAAFCISLYVIAFGPLLLHRVAWPLWLTIRHRPFVRAIAREADGIFSLYVGGTDLDRLAVRSGQFFVVRALTRRDWTHGHPFSISAAPNGDYLRFTVKELGEGTRSLAALAPGTGLMLEGPYGAMHGGRRTGRRLLLIAGGIGIAPLRALAEGLGFRPGEMDLVYRTRDPRDIALRGELESLAVHRGIRLHLVTGRRGEPGVGDDPLGAEAIRRLVPDAADRDAYLCGPDGLMEHARSALLALGASPSRINLELFG